MARGQNRGTIGVQRETSQGKRVDPRNKEEELHSRWWCCYWVQGLPLFDHCTAAGEESNTRCYHWGFPCFFSQPQTFPAHVGWAERSQTPLSFTEIHFPTEVQLCKPVSIGFICKREGANDRAVTPACRVKSLPSQSSQPQLLPREAPDPLQELGRKRHPLPEAHSKGPAKPRRDGCPSAITHAPVHFLIIHTQGTFLVCFLLSKKFIINPSYFACLPITYSRVNLHVKSFSFLFFPQNLLFC